MVSINIPIEDGFDVSKLTHWMAPLFFSLSAAYFVYPAASTGTASDVPAQAAATIVIPSLAVFAFFWWIAQGQRWSIGHAIALFSGAVALFTEPLFWVGHVSQLPSAVALPVLFQVAAVSLGGVCYAGLNKMVDVEASRSSIITSV